MRTRWDFSRSETVLKILSLIGEIKVKRIKALAVLALIATVTTALLGSCSGGGGNGNKNDSGYTSGTVLRVSLDGEYGIFFDSDAAIEGVTLADGVTYLPGDLKPAIAQLGRDLSLEFSSPTGDTLADTDIIIAPVEELRRLAEQGELIDLSKYFSKMPDFSTYLRTNGTVRLSLIGDSISGNVNFAPTLTGDYLIGRMPVMRADWIEKLLNGSGPFTAERCGSLSSAHYTPFMPTVGRLEVSVPSADGTSVDTVTKNYSVAGNVIETMNIACSFGELTGVDAVNILRSYIDDAYGGYYGTDRADLFIGTNAAWDADELVALLRCVVANAPLLTGGDEIRGVFPSSSDKDGQGADILSFAGLLFGARGLDSASSYLYLDSAGELCDARAEERTYIALEKANSLIREGLISTSVFDGNSNGDNTDCFSDGFMYYGFYDARGGANMRAALPPVSLWDDGSAMVDGVDTGKFLRFTESSSPRLTSGIGISSSGIGDDKDKLNAALALINRLFGEDGEKLMTLAPDAFLVTEDGEPVTAGYRDTQIPLFGSETLDDISVLAGGDAVEYARKYLGSCILKDNTDMLLWQTDIESWADIDKYHTAISLGTLSIARSDLADNPWYTAVPSDFSLTYAEKEQLREFSELAPDGKYSFSEDGENLLVSLLEKGYSSKTFPNRTEAITYFTDKCRGAEFIAAINASYVRLRTYNR